MKHIIKHIVNIEYYNGSTYNRIKLFRKVWELSRENDELNIRKAIVFLKKHMPFLETITSKCVLIYVYDYLIQYKLPDLNKVQEVYTNEAIRYLVIESLLLNTPLEFKYIGLDKESIIVASNVGSLLNIKSSLIQTTKLNISSLISQLGYNSDKILLVWEAQGLCQISGNLVVLIGDVFELLSKHPCYIVHYLLKWNRNERLKGIKLI